MSEKTAHVHWQGEGKRGFGTITTESEALKDYPYGFVIDRIALTLQATVPNIDEVRFQEIAAGAKQDCRVSRALAGVAEITLVATLQEPHANFETPAQIVADPAQSKDEKVEMLEEMEQDARQLATASAEGMGGGEPTNLHEVLGAKEALGLPAAYDLVLSDLKARARLGAPDAALKSAIEALDGLVRAESGAA